MFQNAPAGKNIDKKEIEFTHRNIHLHPQTDSNCVSCDKTETNNIGSNYIVQKKESCTYLNKPSPF